MGDWPILSDGGKKSLVAVTLAATDLITFNAGNSNSMGAWTQIVAATPHAASGFWVCVVNKVNLGDYLFNIGIGAAGSEVVIVPYILVSRLAPETVWIYVPIAIPANTRMVAQAQTVLSSGTNSVGVGIYLIGQGFIPSCGMGRVMALGVNTAASTGTALADPGAVAHTKGAWQAIATTVNPVRWLYAIPGMRNTTHGSGTKFLLDIAVGAAGSEVVILPNLFFSSQNSVFVPNILGPFPVSVAPGISISARFQTSSTAAADRGTDLILYGVD
jgi:hypothetical protein